MINKKIEDEEFRARRRQYKREWYNRIKHKERVRTKKKREEEKKIVIKHYTKDKMACVCCGMTGIEFLTVDHIIGKKEMTNDKELKKINYKEERRSSRLYLWLKTKNFPKGFQILCYNCNFAKGSLGYCPHQK